MSSTLESLRQMKWMVSKMENMTKVNLKELSDPKSIADAVFGIYVTQCIKGGSFPDSKAFFRIKFDDFNDAKKYE